LAALRAARRNRAMSAIDPRRRRLLGLRRAGTVEGGAAHAPVAAPVIDPLTCIACDACVRVCEPGALRLDPVEPSYAVDAARCTDCGLCVDVCDRNAVRLERDAPAAVPTRVALYARHCRECGGDFHTTQAGPAATCRFCSRPPAARGALRLQE
jgi:ferredoxin